MACTRHRRGNGSHHEVILDVLLMGIDLADDGAVIFTAFELHQRRTDVKDVPSAPHSLAMTPATGEGTSTSALAVSTDNNTWSTLTVSPALTFHSTISASAKPSPRSGNLKNFIATGSPSADEPHRQCPAR